MDQPVNQQLFIEKLMSDLLLLLLLAKKVPD